MLKEVSPSQLKRSIQLNTARLEIVEDIVKAVQQNGERAALEYTLKLDATEAEDFSLFVHREEIERYTTFGAPKVEEAILTAKRNIEDFHKTQRAYSHSHITRDGAYISQAMVALDRVAIYVPGGKAFYPSTVLMTAIPAIVAGVKEIVMFTPPAKDGSIRNELLYLANVLGVKQLVKAGGAQAIALAAFGASGFAPVDKIVGPGNDFVTLAKKLVYGYVDIDMLAGPSEIMVIADGNANASFIARDLITQAEHDEAAVSVLVSTSKDMIERVNVLLKEYSRLEERKDIIEKSLINNGLSVLVSSLDEAFEVANSFGPEHLEILADVSESTIMSKIRSAGSVFMGEYCPEPMGDYLLGSNHVLPTYGSSRFSSPLGVYDFYRRINFVGSSKESFSKMADKVIDFARYEGLNAHANAVNARVVD